MPGSAADTGTADTSGAPEVTGADDVTGGDVTGDDAEEVAAEDVAGEETTADVAPAGPCVGLVDGEHCDLDGDPCTLDVCGNGACVSTGMSETCQSEQAAAPCWTFTCSKKNGCAPTVFVEGASCQDGNPCTVNDACKTQDIKACVGTPIAIDDGNVCTDDACQAGTVSHAPLTGVPCSVAGASGECSAGVCVVDPCPSGPCGSCPLPWGGVVADGESVTAYAEPSVPCGGACQSEVRVCQGGVLGGSFGSPACQVAACGNELQPGVYDVGEQIVSAVVPAGVTSIDVKLWGGGGGGGSPGDGGGGAYVHALIQTTPGATIELRVGGGGAAGGGGGGASYVLLGGQVAVVAAAGGGGGCDGCSGCSGGIAGQGGGGGALGASGQDGEGNDKYNVGAGGGHGGAPTAGGAAGTILDKSIYDQCAVPGKDGGSHTGGAQGTQQCGFGSEASWEVSGKQGGCNGSSGGGGAGWFGGGSGSQKWTYAGGGGGGGSSYLTGAATAVSSEGGAAKMAGGANDPDYGKEAGRGGRGDKEAFGDPNLPGAAGRIVVAF